MRIFWTWICRETLPTFLEAKTLYRKNYKIHQNPEKLINVQPDSVVSWQGAQLRQPCFSDQDKCFASRRKEDPRHLCGDNRKIIFLCELFSVVLSLLHELAKGTCQNKRNAFKTEDFTLQKSPWTFTCLGSEKICMASGWTTLAAPATLNHSHVYHNPLLSFKTLYICHCHLFLWFLDLGKSSSTPTEY